VANKLYVIRFKAPEDSVQPVEAERHEISGDYLVLFDQDGSIAAFFALDVVQDSSIEDLPEGEQRRPDSKIKK